MAFGRVPIGAIGTGVMVSVDGRPLAKVGGVTIDWSTVTAVSGSDVTVNDGVVVKIGEKYLRMGQVVCLITSSGLYGPYDPAAGDGRQTLAIGKAFVLNRAALAAEPKDDYPEAIYGGQMWYARLVQSLAATHTLALGPTLAEFQATFPQAQLVYGT